MKLFLIIFLLLNLLFHFYYFTEFKGHWIADFTYAAIFFYYAAVNCGYNNSLKISIRRSRLNKTGNPVVKLFNLTQNIRKEILLVKLII